jgi:hypothetical protein
MNGLTASVKLESHHPHRTNAAADFCNIWRMWEPEIRRVPEAAGYFFPKCFILPAIAVQTGSAVFGMSGIFSFGNRGCPLDEA